MEEHTQEPGRSVSSEEAQEQSGRLGTQASQLIAERDGYAAALEARLDCGKDADCADEVETQEQCKKHYELYVEREIAGPLDRLQKRFNEVWKQHQRMLLALENARLQSELKAAICGHTPEEHREEIRECEEPDCDCGMFEPREDDEEET